MSAAEPGAMRTAYLGGSFAKTALGEITCPGCARANSLSLLQAGRESSVPGLEDRPPLWGCPCGWQGWEKQLIQSTSLDIQVQGPEGSQVAAAVYACWLEQEQMRVSRSGGGGSKGRKREPKRGKGRPEQEALGGGKDTVVRTVRVEAKTEMLEVRLTVDQREAVEMAASLGSVSVTQFIEDRLAELFLGEVKPIPVEREAPRVERLRWRITAGQKRLLTDTAQAAGVTVTRLVEHALADVFCSTA